eukprot:TRINITY_DN72165_c0_g1_i1.p1 TRINITY_DN72165_c0_g1~~TRINITY_DN72165_c0_g1_i1.p1  ORF type:complete len:220 (+),score=25.42 TRINITY_DN72165_c0_g1_i1:80-739(+)
MPHPLAPAVEETVASAVRLAESDGWEQGKVDGGFTLCTRPVPGSSMRAVRIQGSVSAPMEKIVAYLQDASNDQKWDPTQISRTVVEPIELPHSAVEHTHYKSPGIGVSARDFINVRALATLPDGRWIQAFQAVEIAAVGDDNPAKAAVVEKVMAQPVTKGSVRGQTIACGFVLSSTSPTETALTYVVHVDPKGWLPAMAVNSAHANFLKMIVRLKDQVQ